MSIESNNCKHCQLKLDSNQQDFCCVGCSKAYEIINKLGFKNYYEMRQIDIHERNLKPEIDKDFDISEFIRKNTDGSWRTELMIQGLQCGACVWLIENVLYKNPQVIRARINLTRKILTIDYQGQISDGNKIISPLNEIGYKFLPFDQAIIVQEEKKYNDSLLKALAVAGFGAGNIMLFSFALWFTNIGEMGLATHQIFQFFSALIALPVLVYSARIFFISAYRSLLIGQANMDLPISLAIILAGIVSIFQAFNGQDHVYFDSVVMLIFFLLIGRFLDMKARKKAFNIATQFSLLNASFARVDDNGKVKILPIKKLQKEMILLVASGEKIASDGIVIEGESEIDDSLLTGEIALKKVSKNSQVFAGTINLLQPLKIKITSAINSTLLSQIIDLINQSESNKNSCELIAQKLAKIYTPLVHILAFITFVIWYFINNESFQLALMNATAVLIITCPCALALAIPIVQTIVISGFISKKILIKNGEALEKINKIDMVIFDKTGSLTMGTPSLKAIYLLENKSIKLLDKSEADFYLMIALTMAKKSMHTISQALMASCDYKIFDVEVKEEKSLGLIANFDKELIKKILSELRHHHDIINIDENIFKSKESKIYLGRSDFCKINKDSYRDELLLKNNDNYQQLTTFMRINQQQIVFVFDDQIKEDAEEVVLFLKKIGKKVILLSGDSQRNVELVAKKLAIKEFYYEKTILQKAQFLKDLQQKNHQFMMIGDGLNDAPALSLATVSVSFTKASDLSKNIADILINSTKLSPIIPLFIGSKKAFKLMRQNLFLALLYNLIALPFALMGMVVPLVAALAMSSSSLLVILNSLRINNFFINKKI
jgi:Cu2+-exporting ATPase